jgi:hypothetical protein
MSKLAPPARKQVLLCRQVIVLVVMIIYWATASRKFVYCKTLPFWQQKDLLSGCLHDFSSSTQKKASLKDLIISRLELKDLMIIRKYKEIDRSLQA